MNLRAGGNSLDLFRNLEGPLVLVADELTPSTVAQLDWPIASRPSSPTRAAGPITRRFSRARLHVPAVAGLRDASRLIAPGALLAVDGATGDVFVDPDPALLEQIRGRQQQRVAYEQSLDEYRGLPAVTEDGVQIRLEANVESPDDARRARESGADGIGLFRSEFLLAGRGPEALGEDAQFEAYARLVESMAPGRVTIRTFDVSEAQLPVDAAGATARARRSGCAASASASRSTTCSRRSSARCCAPRRTDRCASCSRSSRASRNCARPAPRCSAPRKRCARAGNRSRPCRSAS